MFSFGLGSYITLVVVTEPVYADYSQYPDIVEVGDSTRHTTVTVLTVSSLLQALPGGFVTRLNRSCIQVLDGEGDGVFFLLNDEEDQDDEEPVPSGSDETNTDEVEYVNVNGDIPDVEFIDDEEDSSEEEKDTNISNESIDDDDDYKSTSQEEEVDSSQDDEDNNSQENEDRSIITETTTKIPLSVLDPSRFDVVNDKITSSPEAPTVTTPEAPEVATEMETTTLTPDPTLNVDPGLLE